MKAILELDEPEIQWWLNKIGAARKRHVLVPKDLIRNHIDSIKNDPAYIDQVRSTSSFIRSVRDATWSTYVDSELLFYREVINELLQHRSMPHQVLASIITQETMIGLGDLKTHTELLNQISDIFGHFAGRIFPYFFELSKSVTNSRRSRAGKAFEEIICSIMQAYCYPYSSQSAIGRKVFEEKGLGKIVDGILPSMCAYDKNRSKCMVVTMKTTLRERWQEVVEELQRTNVPAIHLLTLDENISSNVLNLMKNHNITLVTYRETKSKFENYSNIISFESFFNVEIPHTIDWWQRAYPDMSL